MANARRKAFDAILKEALGSEHVYYQPPSNVQMQYPCIVYERDDTSTEYADDIPYNIVRGYQVTHIDHLPDSDVLDKLEAMSLSKHDRHFVTSGLNHDVFVIYY